MPISQQEYAMMMARELARTPGEVKRVCGIEDSIQQEGDLHAQIEDECQNRGWFYVHSRMDKPTTTACGVTDFIIARDDGRTLWVEAKRKGGKLTPHQQAVVHWLKRSKQIVAVVYSLEEFIAVSKMP